jgi:hypothetical protein
MEYEYEHINVDTPDEQWVDELARMFAEIIYREMIEGKINEEKAK